MAGRDIKRYGILPDGRYLILFPKGWTKKQTHENHWDWLQKNLPAISSHLTPFAEAAQKRGDKGDFWWELRACDYYKEFEQPKIIIPAIVKSASYSYDNDKFYSNDKTAIIPTDDKYLLAVLNSNLIDYFMHKIASTKQGGYFEYKPVYLSQLPIAKPSIEVKNIMEDKVMQIFEAKKDNPKADTSSIEYEVDQMIYQIYSLTEEEIAIVEGETVKAEA